MPTDTRMRTVAAALEAPGGPWRPRCMTLAEHHAWQAADRETGYRGGRPCADCPAEWRAERLAEGTCNEEVTLGRGTCPSLQDG